MRFRTGAALAAISVALLAGCSSTAPTGGGGGGGETEGAGGGSEGPFTIGVSNGFVGSEYRTQMIEDIQTVFDEYKENGTLDELVLENADTDVNGQIQQVRNLINRGVDAIIINPNSGTALDAVFQEALGQGIRIYAIDQAVETEEVVNVGIDQPLWAETSAQWLAEQVGEGGRIVVVNGIEGHPANEARWNAAKAVFDEAGVEVLAVANGDWDQATGQQVMSDLLATYTDIQGVWTQDGMAQGVLRAVEAANRTGDIIVTGEARNGYMRMWSELKEGGFESIGVVNPPGTGATALHFAVSQLEGRELDESKTENGDIVLDLEDPITNDNFDEVWAEVQDRPDSYVLDSVLTRDEVNAYFVG
ncbi:substrate-binding domain-containing protein [Naasia sp. SYSU D00948]|uniref:substrate-binding domain-containing protein n=1 Tax=Naasia sp. SYSU D00948 TaxID=2817379 RepID=UPI001B3041C0|nr:substrate-binding domain-containing protein [Naasia sp. SYSU D00948]